MTANPHSTFRFILVASLGAMALMIVPATLAAQPIRSTEVAADGRVTFRFKAPNAKEVVVDREGGTRMKMTKDDKGIWTATSNPLEPDLYGYSFVVDGVTMFDPNNPTIKTNFLYTSSLLHVPGPDSIPWEVSSIPHGSLNRHFYHSKVVGDERDVYVYTPPGYDPRARKTYPVLYLLHGFSDDASGWTSVGKAHVILDKMIAAKKAVPMLVVMPLGYGRPEIVAPGGSGIRDRNIWENNIQKFREAFLAEVVPLVESQYRVSADRKSRAVAGLSMGGAESLVVGLNSLDKFAWIGAFSSGGLNANFPEAFPRLAGGQAPPWSLLWISCGVDDGLIGANRKLHEWLTAGNRTHTWKETPGAHTWMVWRRNLAEFVTLIFR